MYREEFPPLRWLTCWLPRLLVAGSFTLAACNGGDTTAPSAGGPGISPSKGPSGQACIGCPVVSSHILFAKWATTGNGHNDIYSMNPDGTGRKVIAATTGDEIEPAWSPNYTRLAFSRTHQALGSLNGLWTIGWDGSQEVRVTNDWRDHGPKWGKTNRIAFYSMRATMGTATSEIFTINPDGTGLVRLTNNAADDRSPDWSPDGSKIVFASNRGGRRGVGTLMHLFVMNADGTGVKQLTFGSRAEDQPAWSPDGTRIVYHDTGGLSMINADGTGQQDLMSGVDAGPGGVTVWFLGQPTWSPESKSIAFTANWNGVYRIYSWSVDDGGTISQLSPQGQEEQFPAWSH
ncbi:MAG: hypothetical protein ACJ8DC_08350 [Gemmatimonadales bacterium]